MREGLGAVRCHLLPCFIGAAAAAFALACVGGPNDKCLLDELRYREARRAYERTNSVELVRKALIDAHWSNCQVNEAVYRVTKEFGLNDKLPSKARVRTEAELQKEEEADAAMADNPSGVNSFTDKRWQR